MSKYKVHKIDLNFRGKPQSIASYIVTSEEGPIVVETGPHSTLPHLEKGLQELGYELSDIKHVLLTHIHLDHAGAAWCFAELGAKIYLHPFGYKHMHDPSKLLASAQRIYGDMMDTLWGTLKPISSENLVEVDDQAEIVIGNLTFKAHYTPGHAKHHHAWQLGEELFAGDVCGVRINKGPVIPPCPPPDINVEDWLASIEHIAALSDVKRYHLAHYDTVVNLEDHLISLRESITSYASWVEPWVNDNLNPKEALPLFREHVKNFMILKGLSEADADAYQAANPPDMSLAGLMRYWTKKQEA